MLVLGKDVKVFLFFPFPVSQMNCGNKIGITNQSKYYVCLCWLSLTLTKYLKLTLYKEKMLQFHSLEVAVHNWADLCF